MTYDPFKPRKSDNPASDILKVGIAVKAVSDLDSISKNMEQLAQAERTRSNNEFWERRERETREKQDRAQQQAHQAELERLAKQSHQETRKTLQDQEVTKEKEQRLIAIQMIQDKGLGIDVDHFPLVQEVALAMQVTLEEAAKIFRDELIAKSWGFALKKEFQPKEQTKEATIKRYPQLLSLNIDLDALAKRTLRYAHKLDSNSFFIPSLEQKLTEAENINQKIQMKELHEQELRSKVKKEMLEAQKLREEHLKALASLKAYWDLRDGDVSAHGKLKPSMYDWRHMFSALVGAGLFILSLAASMFYWMQKSPGAFVFIVMTFGLSLLVASMGILGMRHLVNPKNWKPIEKLTSAGELLAGSDLQFAATVQPKDKSLYPLRLELAGKVDLRKCYRLLDGEADEAPYKAALAVMGLQVLTLAQMNSISFDVMREKLAEKHLGSEDGLRFWLQIHEREDDLLAITQANESQKAA